MKNSYARTQARRHEARDGSPLHFGYRDLTVFASCGLHGIEKAGSNLVGWIVEKARDLARGLRVRWMPSRRTQGKGVRMPPLLPMVVVPQQSSGSFGPQVSRVENVPAATLTQATSRKCHVALCLMDSFPVCSGEMLIKTGQLARRAGILPSKGRFYVKEGTFQPVDQTPGGYSLFDGTEAIERLREIDHLQSKQRLTIREITHKLREADVDEQEDIDVT